jgi:hypothetical protein
MDPSASWSWLLLECSFPFGKALDRALSGEPARYGSAFHSLTHKRLEAHFARTDNPRVRKFVPRAATVAAEWGKDIKPEELDGHVDQGLATLTSWLTKNPFGVNFEQARREGGTLLMESAVALTPLKAGRSIDRHDESHEYHGLKKGEIPGTLDLGLAPARRKAKLLPVLSEDHKTGDSEDFSHPTDKAQLLVLAAAMMRWTGVPEAVVAVLHAPRRRQPVIYAEKVKLHELKRFEGRLQEALARVGDGSMRPGPWCVRCPAQSICPARDADLLGRGGDLLTGLTAAGGALSKGGLTANDVSIAKVSPESSGLTREQQLGILYDITRKAERMAERIRDELKKEILAGGGGLLPVTPNGEYLVVREYEKESVSKSSIQLAFGKVAGERELTRLRDAGAMKVTKVQALWPEKERGR